MEEEARHQLLASTFICTYVGVHQHAKHKNIQNKSKKRKSPYIAIFWCISFICLEGQSLKWCWSVPPSSQHLSHTRTSLYILQPRQQLTPATNIPVTARTIVCSSIAQAACDMRTTPTPLKVLQSWFQRSFDAVRSCLPPWLFLSVFFGAPVSHWQGA